MIEQNVKQILSRLAGGNAFHEQVTLVAASKTRSIEEINHAVQAGVTDVGENKVQEFCEKYDAVVNARKHFIGHLQTNKVKYLIGKAHLIHSLDRDELADELIKRSRREHVVTNVLVQVNIGNEESKGGYPLEEAFTAYQRFKEEQALSVRGFMAMLPVTNDIALLHTLCKKMRALFERARDMDEKIAYLSMGMSGDWELCMEHGANMIRLGSAIFGERDYSSRRE